MWCTLKPGSRFWNKLYGHHFDAVIWRNYSANSVNKAKYLWISISQAWFLSCLELIISSISEVEERGRTSFELQKVLIIRKGLWTEWSLSIQKGTVLISVLREAQKVHLSLSFFSPLVLVFQLLTRKTSESRDGSDSCGCCVHNINARTIVHLTWLQGRMTPIYFPMEN